jgi:hypothetical protein
MKKWNEKKNILNGTNYLKFMSSIQQAHKQGKKIFFTLATKTAIKFKVKCLCECWGWNFIVSLKAKIDFWRGDFLFLEQHRLFVKCLLLRFIFHQSSSS